MKRAVAALMLACLVGSPALAQEAMTGMFRMSHTVGEILGDQMAKALDDTVPSDQALQWQVYVPWDYDPSRPPGVFIYLDPNRYGGIPDQWTSVFDQHNMIWVGPRVNERRQSEEKKIWHAVLGLRAIESQYAIDLNRIYIASARDTTPTALKTALFANEITGVVYMRGSAMWVTISDDQLEQVRRKRHVFITGTNDPAKDQVRGHYEAHNAAGVEHTKLIFDMKRIEEVPKTEHIDAALRFLDGGE
ncbi:MAG: hypothetical protein QNJ23_01695 [Woeseiaceae bacterium]|nr:hypothetical protein [Woeseiaceae bacterium]